MKVGKRINDIRIAHGVKVNELALVCNVTRQCMSKYLNGKSNDMPYGYVEKCLDHMGYELMFYLPIKLADRDGNVLPISRK